MPADDTAPLGWEALAADPQQDFIGLWADAATAYALFADAATGRPRLRQAAIDQGRYPALSPHRPAARLFEAAVHDLWGHTAEGAEDSPALLQHGQWGQRHPLAARPTPMGRSADPPVLDPPGSGDDAAGDRYQLGQGPAAGGFTPPAHLRLTARGETVTRLQTRLGYGHRGALSLLRGKSPRAAAPTIARLAGDSTVAHSIAFARAAEQLSGTTPPPRAQALRGAMGELERIACHLRAIAAVTEAAGVLPLGALARMLRETVLRACAQAFGHRLMMDAVLPGGMALDISTHGPARIAEAMAAVASGLRPIRRDLDRNRGLRRRLEGSGITPAELVRSLGCGGPAARAAGGTSDTRLHPGYPPFDTSPPAPVRMAGGDADTRLRLRLAEITDSIRLVGDLLDDLPAGPVAVPLPPGSGTGLGWAEGARGDCWCWLRLDAGLIVQAFPRDPGWMLWPLLTHTAAGAPLEDSPILHASLDPGGPGVDL
jgi:Ni,Fe-hydrogenase III large subunit